MSRPANGAFMHDAEVGADAHEVAVARRAHHAREHADAARLVRVRAPDHLVGDRVEAVVAAMRFAAMPRRGRIRERHAGVVEALIGEAAVVVPDADLVGARQTAAARRRPFRRRPAG